jgi:hypothetical protein
MTTKQKWRLAKRWCDATDHRGEGRHPININDSGFWYDGTGFFEPQFVRFLEAYRDLPSASVRGAVGGAAKKA